MSQKRIEDIFKDALANDQAPAQDGDWAQMANLLDGLPNGAKEPEQKRRKWLFWLWLPVVVTGVVLFTLFNKTGNNSNTTTAHSQNSERATKPDNTAQQTNSSAQKTTIPQQTTTNTTTGNGTGAAETETAAQNHTVNKHSKEIQLINNQNGLRREGVSANPASGTAKAEPVNRRKKYTPGVTGAGKSQHTVNEHNKSSKKLNKLFGNANSNDETAFRLKNSKTRTTKMMDDQKSTAGKLPAGNDKQPGINNEEGHTNNGGEEIVRNVPASHLQMAAVTKKHALCETAPELPELQTPYVMAGIVLPDTLIKTAARTKQVKRQRNSFGKFVKNTFGLPQWVSVGYDMLPLSANNYSKTPSLDPGTLSPSFSFMLDSSKMRKMSKGAHIAIGSEWHPTGDKWSLNSYAMLQYAQTHHLARTTLVNYSSGVFIADTVSSVERMGALRLGTDWVYHARDNKWQAGVGANASFILLSRGELFNYSLLSTGVGSASGSGHIERSNGLFRGIKRFNLGLSGVIGYRIAHPVWLELRASYDIMDMTRNEFYENYQENSKHNLSYYSIGLKFSLQKKDD